MALPQQVKIVEVGPRDGLQNEKEDVAADVKIELVNRLSQAGFRNDRGGLASCRPNGCRRWPTAPRSWPASRASPASLYSVLTPNMKGFEAALAARADEDRDLRRRQRSVLAEEHQLLDRGEHRALRAGARTPRSSMACDLRGSVSCALGCPYQGEVPVDAVVDVVAPHARRSAATRSTSPTRSASARRSASVQDAIAAARVLSASSGSSGHFHDTYGQALANIYAGLEVGIEIYHASVAGLGGCPYAKGATGNVATEDVLYLMNGLGIETGIDLEQVVAIGDFISTQIGRPNVSRAGKALLAKARSEAANCV